MVMSAAGFRREYDDTGGKWRHAIPGVCRGTTKHYSLCTYILCITVHKCVVFGCRQDIALCVAGIVCSRTVCSEKADDTDQRTLEFSIKLPIFCFTIASDEKAVDHQVKVWAKHLARLERPINSSAPAVRGMAKVAKLPTPKDKVVSKRTATGGFKPPVLWDASPVRVGACTVLCGLYFVVPSQARRARFR